MSHTQYGFTTIAKENDAISIGKVANVKFLMVGE
jgi:hypothetical protein